VASERLAGKTAVITGAASGIGLAIAERFAAEGANVALLDLNSESLNLAVEGICESGGEATGTVCDVGDSAQVDEVISSIHGRCGAIDILVNNAGIAHVGSALTTGPEDFERVQRVNVFGIANCLRSTLKFMAEGDRGGAILNMASTVAHIGIAERFAYSTSKGAVLAMTYSVARDFIEKGIRCNAILPGRIHTPFVDGFIKKNYPGREEEMFRKLSDFQPIGRMGRTEEIAAAALFLCSDEASFVTGADFAIDGGTITLR